MFCSRSNFALPSIPAPVHKVYVFFFIMFLYVYVFLVSAASLFMDRFSYVVKIRIGFLMSDGLSGWYSFFDVPSCSSSGFMF